MKLASPKFCIVVLIALAGFAGDVLAHHSRSRFDTSELVEVEGELVLFSWRNPHVHIQVKSIDENGDEVVWDMEGDSLSILRRTNARPDNVNIGDHVKVAGYKTIRPSNDMLAFNLLTEDGREVLVNVQAEPRWTGDVTGDESIWRVGGSASETRGDIFRVWSTQFDGDLEDSETPGLPLTESARAAYEAFDPTLQVVAEGCEPKGMPMIMGQPYPIEFARDRNDIVLKIEEYDLVRRIHMTDISDIDRHESSLLGHSDGRWDGDTLVVETGRIEFSYYDEFGVPQSSDMHVVEGFRVSDDGSRLEYERQATDDEVFTEPVTTRWFWVWRPGEKVQPYECEERPDTR